MRCPRNIGKPQADCKIRKVGLWRERPGLFAGLSPVKIKQEKIIPKKKGYLEALANRRGSADTSVRCNPTLSRRSTPSVKKIKRSWFCEILTGRPFSQTSRPQCLKNSLFSFLSTWPRISTLPAPMITALSKYLSSILLHFAEALSSIFRHEQRLMTGDVH
jgi:hypothetical protein